MCKLIVILLGMMFSLLKIEVTNTATTTTTIEVKIEVTNTATTTTTIEAGTHCLWTDAKEACIAGENARSETDVATMEDCIDLCKKELSFICVSVDYSAREKTCHLSTMTSKTATSLGNFYEPCHFPDFIFAECLNITGTAFSGQCVVDDSNRLLDEYTTFERTLTPDICIKHCLTKNFTYAGVQYTDQCWCGNTAPPSSKIVAQTECDQKCPGDSEQFCGGTWRMNVFDTATTTTTIEECRADWIPMGSSCYKLFETRKNWRDAEDHCKGEGSHLASIRSDKENEFLFNFTLSGNDRIWVGGTDEDTEGKWIWTDGTSFSFFNWSSPEPNGETTENCLEIRYMQDTYWEGFYYNGIYWNDLSCSTELPFICKITEVATEVINTATTTATIEDSTMMSDDGPTCCVKKTVGGLSYTLVSKKNTREFGCTSNCVYTKDGDPQSNNFCFRAGNLESICDQKETCQGDCCWQGPCRTIKESEGRADGITRWPESHDSVEACAKRCEELPDCKIFHYYGPGDKVHKDCYLHKGGVMTQCEDDRVRMVGLCGNKGCPAGYISKEGDVPGWGQIKGKIKTTMSGCSEECNKLQDCCSYEFSYSSGLCNLNRDCQPTQEKYLDYHFCSKK